MAVLTMINSNHTNNSVPTVPENKKKKNTAEEYTYYHC